MKILYILIGFAIIGAGGWYVMQMQGDSAPNPEMSEEEGMEMQNTETSMPANETQNFSGSMQELMARGGSWTCDVTSNAGGITSGGTTYAANGMVRSDFTSNIPQVGNIESHMIVRDGLAYTWTSMMNTGFKFPISEGEGQAEVSAEVAAQVNQDYDFSCRAWSVDESKFALPTGITF